MQRVQIGPHTVEIEGDLVRWVVGGPSTAAGAHAYFALVEEVLAREGSVFLLTINEHNHKLAGEGRRISFDWLRSHRVSGSAMVGGGIATRTIITLLSRAMALTGIDNGPAACFASESEALAWIAKLRRKQPAT
jgi:hypothetical protein